MPYSNYRAAPRDLRTATLPEAGPHLAPLLHQSSGEFPEMKTELYANNPTKTFVRQAEDYEAAGLDPTMTIIMPFTADDDKESIIAKGAKWPGLMRQMNQVLRENIGGSHGARARAAISKKQPLPTQTDVDKLVTNYDFSGARLTSELGMSEEEKSFRSVLRARLKELLRVGVFSADSETKLTVQTAKENSQKMLPDGKISVEEFDSLVEAAAENADFTYEDRIYTFGGDPEFAYKDDGTIASYENLAAVTAHCEELAQAKLAAERLFAAKCDVKASIPTN